MTAEKTFQTKELSSAFQKEHEESMLITPTFSFTCGVVVGVMVRLGCAKVSTECFIGPSGETYGCPTDAGGNRAESIL